MPFTPVQLMQLSGRDRKVLKQVARYLGHENFAGEDPAEVFEILAPAEGCVPESEVGDILWQAIRQKFACIFWPVTCLLAQRIGCDKCELSLLIDPDHDDSTRLAVIHQRRRQVLLTYAAKAWRFHFDSLREIVQFIDKQVEATVREQRAAGEMRREKR